MPWVFKYFFFAGGSFDQLIENPSTQEIIEIPDVHTILAGIEEYRNVLDLPPYWSVKKFLENRPTSEDIEALVNQQYHIGYMKLHVLIEEFLQKFIQ